MLSTSPDWVCRKAMIALALLGLGCSANDSPESEPACLETLMPAAGANAEAALALVSAPRRASLTWADGQPSEVVFTLEEPKAFSVSSRNNPDFPLDIAVDCRDHILVTGQARLRTEDGRIDETWSSAELRTTTTAGATLVHSIKADSLRGHYSGTVPAGQCFVAFQVNLALTADTFSGSTLDTVANAPCGSKDPQAGVSPRQSSSW